VERTAAVDQRQAPSRLVTAATFFTFAVLIHNFDHVRRGTEGVAADVFWAGTAAIVVEVAVVVLCLRRDRRAPEAAALAGLGLAVGYLVVHFLPARTWLSDSFVSNPATAAVSWIAGSLEVVAALALGLAGLAAVRRRAGSRPAPAPLPLRQALLHPVAAAMILGNAAVIAASFAQR
jgi:hypothetical protein